MAAYGFRRRKHDSTGPGKRECEERSWDFSDDTGVVWVCAVDYCDDWTVGDDFEY